MAVLGRDRADDVAEGREAAIAFFGLAGPAPNASVNDQAGRWSVKVNGNWRVTFAFIGTDVELLDHEDYH